MKIPILLGIVIFPLLVITGSCCAESQSSADEESPSAILAHLEILQQENDALMAEQIQYIKRHSIGDNSYAEAPIEVYDNKDSPQEELATLREKIKTHQRKQKEILPSLRRLLSADRKKKKPKKRFCFFCLGRPT